MLLQTKAPDVEADWGTMTWLVDDAHIADAGLSLARMTVRPGFTTEGHRHPNCSEAIHVISGVVDWIVGGDSFRLKAGDTAFVPPNTAHYATNPGSDAALMMIAYSSGTRIYEKVG